MRREGRSAPQTFHRPPKSQVPLVLPALRLMGHGDLGTWGGGMKGWGASSSKAHTAATQPLTVWRSVQNREKLGGILRAPPSLGSLASRACPHPPSPQSELIQSVFGGKKGGDQVGTG